MTKVDIYSGFLGAGKTTLIKKMIQEAYKGEKLVLIENEFGEIGVDGGFLQDAGINITEMNSGCICCTLVGDFGKALTQVIREYAPDRILIEPSGVGKLSDVIGAVNKVTDAQVVLGNAVAVADVGKVKVYMKNFGEFYNNQIETAGTIILSRTNSVPQNKLDAAVELLRQHNPHAVIITTPWDQLTGEQILNAMGGHASLAAEMSALEHEHHEHHHEHHHDHDEHCTCGCHDHHHHADEVFSSFGAETTKKFSREELEEILETFSESDDYGMVLRAKGIVECVCGKWLHFDYVPGEADIRVGSPAVIGRLCVIGSGIDNDKIKELFKL